MNITEFLQQQARERPDAAAIIDTIGGKDRFTSFAQLERQSAQAAQLLRQQGLQAGDAVLVFYPMSAELYVVLMALFRLGLVAMFLDPSAGRDHIERCCALHQPKALIAAARAYLLCVFSPALRRIPIKFVIGWPLPGVRRWSAYQRLEACRDIVPCENDSPALLTFTSGSTGMPKAALRTHGFLRVQHQVLAKSLHLHAGDVDLATLPIVLLANLASGVTSVIPNADLRYPGAVKPGPVLAQIERHGVISSVASPAFFECLARGAEKISRTFPRLQKLFTGGAAVFPRNLEQMQQMAPNADVVAVYGSTEAEPIAHISRREMTAADSQAMRAGKGLLAGQPIAEIQLRIVRDQWGKPLGPFTADQFQAQCQNTDQPGEIVVTGEHVLKGYLHGHGEEETKFRVDGAVWHRTGDAGYLDEGGRLWLLGRCVARIQDDRGEVYPFAVETVVYQNPQVKRAALISHQGKRVLAVEFFNSHKKTDLDQLQKSLVWASIDAVQICRCLPVDKRHNAKVDYPALYRLLEQSLPS